MTDRPDPRSFEHHDGDRTWFCVPVDSIPDHSLHDHIGLGRWRCVPYHSELRMTCESEDIIPNHPLTKAECSYCAGVVILSSADLVTDSDNPD